MRARLLSLSALVALLVPVALGVRPVAAAVPLAVGLSEQDPDLLTDFRLRALPLDHVRLVVPWDVALSDPTTVGRWLSAAHSGGMEPLVAFEHATGDRCPAAPCALPSAAEYRAALIAFRLRWPGVREWTPWNEPNHPSQPTASTPERAAEYYTIAADVCPACTTVAGDLVDSASMKGYLRDYRAALGAEPSVWGIHDYGDVTYPRTPYTTWLLNQVLGQVWITETGGIVRLTSGTQDLLPYDLQRAAAAIDKAFSLASVSPRIARMYFYNWRAAPWEPFDAGLTAPGGDTRPALDRLFAHLGTRPSVADASAEPPTQGAAPTSGGADSGAHTGTEAGKPGATVAPIALGARPARLTAVRLVRRGLQVRVSCPGRRGCAGQLVVDAIRTHGATGHHLGTAPLRVTDRGAWVLVRIARNRLRPRRTAPRRRLRVVARLTRPAAITVRQFALRVPFGES